MKKKMTSCFGQKKNLKPIEHDVNLKYLCPNPSCCCPHWLTLREAATKNFKVVCYCGQIFSVLRIKNINIEYTKKKKPDRKILGSFEINNEPVIKSVVEIPPEPTPTTPDIKQLAIKHMKIYGFSEEESLEMINHALEENPSIDNHITLIKHSLFWTKK